MTKSFYTTLPETRFTIPLDKMYALLHSNDTDSKDIGSSVVKSHHVLQLVVNLDREKNNIELWYGVFSTTDKGECIPLIRRARVEPGDVTMTMFLDLLTARHPLLPLYAKQLYSQTNADLESITPIIGYVMCDIEERTRIELKSAVHDMINIPGHWHDRLKATAAGWEHDDLTVITLNALFPFTN